MSKEIQPHQQRVIDELSELKNKTDSLVSFVGSQKFQELDAVDQHLLVTQLDTMRAYGHILVMRIDRF